MARVQLRFSPVLPTIASVLLAALWGSSVFAGWGLEAFCAGGADLPACSQRLGVVSTASGLFAVLAVCCTVGAWMIPWSRNDPQAFARLMGAGLLAWVTAEGVLFLGGMLVR